MKMKAYIKNHWLTLFCFLISQGFLLLFFYLWNFPMIKALFLLCINSVLAFVSFSYDYWRRRQYYQKWHAYEEQLTEKQLLGVLCPPASFQEAKEMNALAQTMTESYQYQLIHLQQKQQQYYEYIQLWVHEMKLPLASLQLLTENQHLSEKEVQTQVQRLNTLVEQTLFYAKSDLVAKDYHIQTLSSLAVVQEALQNLASDFIQTKVQLKFSKTDLLVQGDKQWLLFIMQQLLSNSIKYRRAQGACIQLSFVETSEDKRWVLQDNGQGISPKDLPHVFEKGYTGAKGRQNKRATGFGLYLCKTLSEQLNIRLELRSQEGVGTEVCLIFPKYDFTFL